MISPQIARTNYRSESRHCPAFYCAAYIENLDIVLGAVENLLPTLQGKTVITADHGEMLGDRHDFIPTREFNHQNGLYSEPLTKVLWHVIEGDGREDIVAVPPKETDEGDLNHLEDRLSDPGYKMRKGHSRRRPRAQLNGSRRFDDERPACSLAFGRSSWAWFPPSTTLSDSPSPTTRRT